MNPQNAKTSRLCSEDAFLELIDAFFPPAQESLIVGRGDDCAVFACTESLCVSSDLFLQNVHFRADYFSPRDFGYKALAVNISDIAAMGARPVAFVLNLMIPEGVPDAFWKEFFQGMAELAVEHGLSLAGGDLSRAPCMGAAITIWGERPPGGRYLQRAKVRSGDVLFIVGEIGLARLGLTQLENGLTDRADPAENHALLARYPAAVQAHLRPAMHVPAACVLGGMAEIRGLMDVSDGLIRDLPRFLGPDHGCRLTFSEQNLHPELLGFAADTGNDALQWALMGGEDYALLGAVAATDWSLLQQKIPVAWRLGDVTGVPGIMLNEKRIQFQGFDHFQS